MNWFQSIDFLKQVHWFLNVIVILAGAGIFWVTGRIGKLQAIKDASDSAAVAEKIEMAKAEALGAKEVALELQNLATKYVISDKQKAAFLGAFHSKKNGGQFLVSVSPGEETKEFGEGIRDLLTLAGERSIMANLGTIDGPGAGDGVPVIKFRSATHPPLNLSSVLAAFRAAAIEVRTEVDTELPVDTVCIFVPSKPKPVK